MPICITLTKNAVTCGFRGEKSDNWFKWIKCISSFLEEKINHTLILIGGSFWGRKFKVLDKGIAVLVILLQDQQVVFVFLLPPVQDN